MDRTDLAAMSSAVLAFVGDAVYEVHIREHVIQKGSLRPDAVNGRTVRYVRAEAQAAALDALQEQLTEEEAAVARRGRNHKVTSMPRNADLKIYKKATGFEALIGWLELAGEKERLRYIMEESVRIIESTHVDVKRHRPEEAK
ncbi:MAG: Mini-ribonuclease 3 [Clostridia bacterium]|nr:Mini-ribonuclease 3 [Clostridia bacterium]